MNKKHFLTVSAACLLGLALSSCQIAPVNATTKIDSVKGAGSKTLSALVLVDGSCQIEPTPFGSNSSYYVVNSPDFSDVQFTPKADGAKVKLALDGYLTNPNGLATTQAVWDEFNQVVESYVPEGFNFNLRTVQSSDWKDEYMDTVPGADVKAWKGYVYQVSYSWNSTEEYIEKTKKLIGNSYEVSHLKEYEDEHQKPWASLTKNDDGTYTWSEAYLVNYWSVYDIADQVTGSKYFNRAALGADFAVTTDNTFAVALQEYRIGDSDPVTVQIDNTQGTDENMNLKFISATGSIKSASKNNTGLIVGIVILCAYAFVLFRIIQISRRASNLRGSLICYGVFAYLLTHIIVNLFGVMGMIPLTGVPLPFLSYGGSYTICLMIAMGLVQRVAIESKKNTNKTKVM